METYHQNFSLFIAFGKSFPDKTVSLKLGLIVLKMGLLTPIYNLLLKIKTSTMMAKNKKKGHSC